MADLVHAAHGSVFDTITTDTFNTAPFVLAPDKLMQAFEALVLSVFERILNNCRESRTLAGLRDTLLPKVISGELRVKEAEKFAAA